MPIVTTDLSLLELISFSLGAGYLNGFDGSFLFPTIGVGMLTFSFSLPPVSKFFCCFVACYKGLTTGGWRSLGTSVSLGTRVTTLDEGNNWERG